MNKNRLRAAACALGTAAFVALSGATVTVAAPSSQGDTARAEHARIVAHWTAERLAAASPRDLAIDERGRGYLKKPDGSFEPYGHAVAVAAGAASPTPMAKPGGDTTGPVVAALDPSGKTIGSSYTFKATVTDSSGVRSVSFRVGPAGGTQQSFTATAAGDVYSVQLSGFSNGPWTWSVLAKDKANNTTTATASFTVDTAGGGGGGDVVTNSPWTANSTVTEAAGRIYFEMPSNSRRTRWAGYVCSGTVVTDGVSGRSVIQTAAHCVYDDAYKAFARNVLFIPNQAFSGTTTDRNCSNDKYGCWTPAFGVVDTDWTTRTFPNNVAWDYAYYVVKDTGAHSGSGGGPDLVLDATTGTIDVDFGTPTAPTSGDTRTHALGYSYSDDPQFMYCAEGLTSLDAADWWLGSCGLSGGASGGPWMLPFDSGNGTLVSVNSWGYTNQPGMAGPKLNNGSAQCVFDAARDAARTPFPASPPADGTAGFTPTGC